MLKCKRWQFYNCRGYKLVNYFVGAVMNLSLLAISYIDVCVFAYTLCFFVILFCPELLGIASITRYTLPWINYCLSYLCKTAEILIEHLWKPPLPQEKQVQVHMGPLRDLCAHVHIPGGVRGGEVLLPGVPGRALHHQVQDLGEERCYRPGENSFTHLLITSRRYTRVNTRCGAVWPPFFILGLRTAAPQHVTRIKV